MATTEQLNAALAGRYTIERKIGEGGMAAVYLARDLRHQRQVALKVLKPDLGAVVGVERFLSEIQVTANLQHPNLLPLFDSGTADGLLFYVMPYVEGESLRTRLDRERQLPVDDAVRIAVAIASALDYAHRRGVIHRDLKPENILLHEGQPLVADFGIALALRNAGGNRITQTGLSLGTPQYMSPEQATGDRAIDLRTDIYSLGAVTYEMLTGEPPHSGNTAQAIIARLLTESPRPIRTQRPSVSGQIEAAVERALEKLPADRWSSTKEFSEALEGERTVVRTQRATTPETAANPSTHGVPRPWRALPGRVLALAAAAVATAGAFHLGSRSARQAPLTGMFQVEAPDSTTLAGAGPFALSRDGRLLAVAATRNRVSSIYVRALDERQWRQVSGTDSATYPSFSPDGRRLLFSAQGTLKTVAVSGGEPRSLADSATGGGSWGDADVIVYERNQQIWSVNAKSGEVRRITTPGADTSQRSAYMWPTLLPGNKHVLATMRIITPGQPRNATTVLLSIDDGSATRIDSGAIRAVYSLDGTMLLCGESTLRVVRYSPGRRRTSGRGDVILTDARCASELQDSRSAEFSISQNGVLAYEGPSRRLPTRLVSVDRGGTARQLPVELRAYGNPRISPRGDMIAVESDGIVGVIDTLIGTFVPLSPHSASRPEWSYDGTRVAWMRPSKPDYSAVWWRRADRSDSATVMASIPPSRGLLIDPSFGPPHTYHAFMPSINSPFIWIAHADSLNAIREFARSSTGKKGPRISPNGRMVALVETEGRSDVYLYALPGPGERVQVSRAGGSEPVWSPDGKELFFRGPAHMYVARIADTPQPKVLSVEALFEDVFERNGTHPAYDAFRNGSLVMIPRQPPQRTRFVVITNWHEYLRRQNGMGSQP